MPLLINQTQYPQEFALHRKYAQSELLLNLVWTHCNIINDLVIQIYQRAPERYDFPIEVAMQAALCHEVGIYQCGGFEWLPDQPPMTHSYAEHTIVGAWILYQEGYLPEVVQVANIHAGVGLTVEDIQTHQLQLPLDNYVPATVLQQLVTFASKYHSKTPRFKTTEEIRHSLQEFSEEKLIFFNQMLELFGEPQIDKISHIYEEWHRAFSYEINQLQSAGHAGFSSTGISNVG